MKYFRESLGILDNESLLYFYWHVQSNANSSNTDGLFTMAYSKSFLSLKEILPIAIFRIFFFFFCHEIVCCVYSLELPHQGDSNEYTRHTITL